MGNVTVQYKASRGSHLEGDPIDDPKDWLNCLLSEDFDSTKEMYDTAPADVQAEIDSIFDGNIFLSKVQADMWLDLHDDQEELAVAKERVQQVLGM